MARRRCTPALNEPIHRLEFHEQGSAMANADPITGSGVLRREWRGLARLVLESFAAGIDVSVALALAVFIVTTPPHAAGSDAGHGTLYLKEGNGNKIASPLLFTDVHMDVSG